MKDGKPTEEIDAWWTGSEEKVTTWRFLEAMREFDLTPAERIDKHLWFRSEIGAMEQIIELQTTDPKNRDHSLFFMPPKWDGLRWASFPHPSHFIFEILPQEEGDPISIFDPIKGTQWVKDSKILRADAIAWWRIQKEGVEAIIKDGPLANWWKRKGAEITANLKDGHNDDYILNTFSSWQETAQYKDSESALPGHIVIFDPDEKTREFAVFRCGGYQPPKRPEPEPIKVEKSKR